MGYTEITNRTSPNRTAGRGGAKIGGITIHWWGDPNQNPTAEGVVNWLCNPAAQVSAHFVATGTGRRVWQLVNDADTAWHAGNWTGNTTTIGIELDPRCRDEDYDVAAELIADLRRHYGNLPLVPHNKWVGTRCPGNYDLNRLERLVQEKLNPKPPVPPNPTKPVADPVRLPEPIKFISKLQKTEVWNLATNPNYKSVKTLSLGEEFMAAGYVDFNGTRYYVTEYSLNKKLPHGVNQHDLVRYVAPEPPVVDPVKPEEPEAPDPVEPEKPENGFTDADRTVLQDILKGVNQLIEWFKKIFNIGDK